MKQLLKNQGIVNYYDATRYEVTVHIQDETGKIVAAAEMTAKNPKSISKIYEIQEEDLSFFSTFDATEEEETEIFMFLFDLWITKYRCFLSETAC